MLTEGANEVKLSERTMSITRVKVMGWMKKHESDDGDLFIGTGPRWARMKTSG